jgi:uncharacterized protein DUF6220
MIAARYAYMVLAWAFVVGVLVQVFFIGLGLFGDPASVKLHVEFGWILHLAPILIVIAAVVARAGRRRILQAVGLAAIIFVVPILPSLRDSAPVVAALHPVLAVLAFGAAVGVGIAATRFVRVGRAEGG